MDSQVEKHNSGFVLSTLKSFAVLCLGAFAFVIIITLFPLIGSLTMDHFPIMQVIKDNFSILPPLLFVSILISPILGWASTRLKKKRFLYLLLIGVGGCWMAIIAVMLIWTHFIINLNDAGNMFLLSIWAMLAYFFMSAPILAPAILLIERWTR